MIKSQSKLARFKEIAENQCGVSVAEAAEHGISRKLLSNWAKAGRIQRVACGVYQLPSKVPDEMELLSLITPKIAFSHESALFLNGISERCPVMYSVTLPSSATRPRFGGIALKTYYVREAWFEIGLERQTTSSGGNVWCYNRERTICDIIRSRSRVDEETIVDALRRYAASQVKDLNRLANYSRLFAIEKLVHERLGVLL